MEGSHFPLGQGTFRKIGVQFWGKVAVAGYTPPFFGHGRVKVGVVDQSAVSVSRCKRVDTLRCHFLTGVYPVVSFTLNSNINSTSIYVLSRLYVYLERKRGKCWKLFFSNRVFTNFFFSFILPTFASDHARAHDKDGDETSAGPY